MSKANKTVIITGSSSGFGLKAAKDFSDKGYLLVVNKNRTPILSCCSALAGARSPLA